VSQGAGGSSGKTSPGGGSTRQRAADLVARLRAAWKVNSKRSRAFFHAGPVPRLIVYILLVVGIFLGFVLFGRQMANWASNAVINTINCARHPVRCFRDIVGVPPPPPTPTPVPGPTQPPPPTPLPEPRPRAWSESTENTIQTWTRNDVLRHLLILGLTIWGASRLAGIYFGDLHHIEDFRFTSQLLRRTILARAFGKIVVQAGQIEAKDQKGHNLERLLGAGIPAAVQVAPDSCLVVELMNGEPVFIGPTGGKPALLRAFSRLRRAVDLRDQEVTLTVNGIARDGLPVAAKDVALCFSVARAGQAATNQQPYPFDEQALRNLVYRTCPELASANGKVVSRVQSTLPPSNQGKELYLAMVEQIEVAFREFISRCAAADLVPFTAPGADAGGGAAPTAHNSSGLQNPIQAFVEAFNAQALMSGIELAWLGKGEWVLPGEIVVGGGEDARKSKKYVVPLADWQRSVENWQRRKALLGDQMDLDRHTGELLALVRQVPLGVQPPAAPPGGPRRAYQIGKALIQAYRDKLDDALKSYQQAGQTPPSELVDVIEHLNQLIERKP